MHPSSRRIVHRWRHALTRLHAEAFRKDLCIEFLGGFLIDGNGLFSTRGAREADAAGVAVAAALLRVFREIDGIDAINDAGSARRVHLDFVDICGEIGGEVVCRLAVGHHHQGVNLSALSAIDGEDGILPFSWRDGLAGKHGKLLCLFLSETFRTLAETDEHHASSLLLVDHDMNKLLLGRQFDGFFQINAGAKQVASKARTLESEQFGCAIGHHTSFCIRSVELVVVNNLHVALQCSCSERRMCPRVVDTD